MDSKALFKIQCGLFVAAVGLPEKVNGCITNTLMEHSHVPVRLSVTIQKRNYTHGMILEKRCLCVSALAKDADVALIKRFGFKSGRDVDKFADFDAYELDVNGNPALTGDEIAAVFSLNVYDTVDAGTHTIFLCEAADMRDLGGEPITYGDYRASLKNK